VCALNCEAKPWVDFYGLKKRTDKPFWHYTKEAFNVEVVISGIGAVAMATAVGWMGASSATPGVWLNLGIAGHATMSIGTIHRVTCAVNANNLIKKYPPLTAKWKGENSAIASVNVPSNSYAEGAMIDMESYAFLESASNFSSCELVQAVKVISDNQEQGFDQLNAAKITELMLPHVDIVNEFIGALIDIVPDRAINQRFDSLLEMRGSHSQRQQLRVLLDRACVLKLDDKLESLSLSAQSQIKTAIGQIEEIIEKSAPNLLT